MQEAFAPPPRWLGAMLWLTLTLILMAALCDLRTREIPDWIPLALVVAAMAAAAFRFDAMPLSWRAIGLGAGFGLGALLFALGAMGGGDAKLMAGMGATLGPPALLVTLLYSAAFGGLLIAIALVRRRVRGPIPADGASPRGSADSAPRKERRELAYGPAFVLGLLAFIALGGDLGTSNVAR